MATIQLKIASDGPRCNACAYVMPGKFSRRCKLFGEVLLRVRGQFGDPGFLMRCEKCRAAEVQEDV